MTFVGVAVGLAAVGASVAFFLIDGLGPPRFSLVAMIIRCTVLTPSAVWIDWHWSKRPLAFVSTQLWIVLPIVGMLLCVLVPYPAGFPDPPIAGLVREIIIALATIGVPGAVVPVVGYVKSHLASKPGKDSERG